MSRYTFLALTVFVSVLAACSSAPAPAVSPAGVVPPAQPVSSSSLSATSAQTVPATALSSSQPQSSSSAVHLPVADTLTKAIDPCSPAQIGNFDWRLLHHCVDSLELAGNDSAASVLLSRQIDSRNNLEQLARRTLQQAHLLAAQGRKEDAAQVIEDFLVYKPALVEWMDSAAALEARLAGGAAPAPRGDYSSLIKQIRNLGAVGADYGQVRMLTDSLRLLQPGDSLVAWSETQDELALQRSLGAIRKESLVIKTLVNEQADYAEALRKTDILLRKYPDLADSTGLQALRAWIGEQSSLYAPSVDSLWWKTRSPADSLKAARAHVAASRYTEARALYRKLLGSSLRKDARTDLGKLAESFCAAQRAKAADRFGASRRDTKRAVALLDEAIGALDRCLADYPDVSVADKVRQNRELLLLEKNKLTGETP